jgi:death-on-curing protein
MADRTASEIRGCSKPLSTGLRSVTTGLIEEAAALWESLSQNHAFIDGNKRTALDATYTFVAINFLAIDGARLMADSGDTYAFVVALYDAHQFRFGKLAPWSRSHVTM